MDIKKLTERINFLYNKSREKELSPEEKQEQNELRRHYIDLMKNNLKIQLDTMVEPKSKIPEI